MASHAVVQLRQEDKRGVLYGLVGFQTKLRKGAQQRIFRTLPGASGAVFARYGSVHRNTYVNAPRHLGAGLELAERPGLRLAGQIAGVEGYVESAALGWLAGVNTAFAARGAQAPLPPEETAHGALLRYLLEADARRFQPMNVNYGLFPLLDLPNERGRKLRRRERHERMAERALEALVPFQQETRPGARAPAAERATAGPPAWPTSPSTCAPSAASRPTRAAPRRRT
jgi:methylenetetrahydrofolate--tRNA-(uracil-5-)-methyltransferase